MDLYRRRDFSALRSRLGAQSPEALAGLWPELETMQKVVFFKLLEPEAAVAVFAALPPEERYRMLGSIEPGSAAPVTEDLSAPVRALFRRLPEEAAAELHRIAFSPALDRE